MGAARANAGSRTIVESPRYNLLVRLHKWAWRQDENFLTESLAFVLEHLLENEPEAGVRIVALMTGGSYSSGQRKRRHWKFARKS
jgi:hypothetical protein